MQQYTLSELSEKSGLTKAEVRKHLISQSLINKPATKGYFVFNLDAWLRNLQESNNAFEVKSFFDDVELYTSATDQKESYCEVDISKRKRCDNWIRNRLNGIKFADFFCGAGGISLGLIMAGYEPVLGVEIDKYAYETYLNNLGERFCKLKSFPTMDITDSNNKKHIISYLIDEKTKLICGGFPCQGFSVSGSRVISDPRNTLYHDMLEIIEKVKPDYVLMENVLGILTIHEGKVFNKIINDYSKLGYCITYKEINAADYEVAQTRKRVIIMANRCNKKNVFPLAINTPDKYVSCGQILERFKNIPENPAINHIFSVHSDEMKKRLLAVPPGKSLYPNYKDSWKKLSKDKPSYTVKGNHGATNIHYELPRVITPREMAALQSFPDNYIFYGCKRSQLIQIGNAVPPYVARDIGIALENEILK